MNLGQHVEPLINGTPVEFKATGGSMVPRIRSGQKVRVEPVDRSKLGIGDIVLARVKGRLYLHQISSVDMVTKRVQISNNQGRVNGWTHISRVYGIVTQVAGWSIKGEVR